MRKRLLLLRHGQALHNPRAEARRAAGCSFDEFLHTMKEDDALDADLTPLGRQQAAAACNSVDGGAASLGIELIVASSLSRAIETAALAFPEAAASHHKPRQRCCSSLHIANTLTQAMLTQTKAARHRCTPKSQGCIPTSASCITCRRT